MNATVLTDMNGPISYWGPVARRAAKPASTRRPHAYHRDDDKRVLRIKRRAR
jgi:hypothetical protein